MVKLSFTEEEIKMFEKVDWELEDDDTWWFDLIQCDLKQDWDPSDLLNSIQKDMDQKLSMDEIYEKYEKKKSI